MHFRLVEVTKTDPLEIRIQLVNAMKSESYPLVNSLRISGRFHRKSKVFENSLMIAFPFGKAKVGSKKKCEKLAHFNSDRRIIIDENTQANIHGNLWLSDGFQHSSRSPR